MGDRARYRWRLTSIVKALTGKVSIQSSNLPRSQIISMPMAMPGLMQRMRNQAQAFQLKSKKWPAWSMSGANSSISV